MSGTKRHFGEYRYRLKIAAKTHGRTTQDLVHDILALLKEHPDILRSGPNEAATYLVEDQILHDGQGTHYFIETERLSVFLQETVDIKTLDPLRVLTEEVFFACGIIHTCGADAEGFMFGLLPPQRHSDIEIRRHWGMIISTNDWVWSGRVEHWDYEDRVLAKLKFIVGLCAYIRCFPHGLVDGFPDCAKHPAHYKGQKCALIQAVPEVLHTERSGPMPHFRRGHYRYLSSERFTKKRGSLVFVHETFVKGKAKTVKDVREANK